MSTTLTQKAWTSAVNPLEMISALGNKASARKRRLFACACVRSVSHLLYDDRSRQAVALAEAYADQRATNDDLISMRRTLYGVGLAPRGLVSAVWKASNRAAEAVYGCVLHHVGEAPDVASVSNCVADAVAWESTVNLPSWEFHAPHWHASRAEALCRQCDLVREVFRSRSRRAVRPEWLAWKQGVVLAMARDIDEGSRFEELPILADALEDAGCDDDELLTHLRRETPHSRGCWALDQVLGKG